MADGEPHLDKLKDLPEMAQHTQVSIDYGISVLKVAGGWIYWRQVGMARADSTAIAGVFVPEPPK